MLQGLFSLSMRDPKTGKDLQAGKSNKMITWFELESDTKLVEYQSANSVQRDMDIITIASFILSQLFNSQRAVVLKKKMHKFHFLQNMPKII